MLHFNEGHPALAALELAAADVAAGAPLEDALAAARERCVFTTHTPVPAGQRDVRADVFLEAFAGLPVGLGIDAGAFPRPLPHASGTATMARHDAARAPARRAARTRVSLRHGEVAREMWRPLFGAAAADEVPIAHVTNGVHLPTFLSPPMRALLDRHLGDGWLDRASDPDVWAPVDGHPGRRALGRTQRGRASPRRLRQGQVGAGPAPARRGPRERHGRGGDLRRGHPDARLRAADRHLQAAVPPDYDPERVRRIFADGPPPSSSSRVRRIRSTTTRSRSLVDVFGLSQSVGITSRVAFLENYDLSVAAPIVGGCDVWLNVPRPPLEASGTSGMKSAANGGLNLSVLDGWWFEGYDGGNGWEIDGDAAPGEDDAAQDARHAHALYDLLEQQVIPLFHDRDADGIPRRWLAMVKHSLRTNGPRFSATRMVEEYAARVYPPG